MRSLLRAVRQRARKQSPDGVARPIIDDEETGLIERCRPYTLTSDERLIATADAVEYAIRRKIPGAMVECGVWRGGSVLAMVLTLQRLEVEDRDVYLFDTFSGMTQPGELDTSPFDPPALDTFERAKAAGQRPWNFMFDESVSGLDQVKDLLLGTGYPSERIHFVVGPVEETLPHDGVAEIAVLRLDTDWYESTKHELETLYPRISPAGVLIVDDYGHWRGSRMAVDEYFDVVGSRPLLARTDYAGRMGVKA